MGIIGLFGSSGPPSVSAQTDSNTDVAGICGRTPEVQANILVAINDKGGDCADVTGEDLAGITLFHIVVQSGGSSEFKSGDFDGLSAVTVLRFRSANQVTALPEDIFDGLDSLEELILTLEQSVLPEDIFDDLDSLEELQLTLELPELPESIFDGLSNLKSLTMNISGMSTLPADVFDGLDKLESLILHSNQIAVLPDDVFDGLDKLESLSLHSNQIAVLPDDVFDGLDSLTKLLLDTNEISELPANVFDELDGLRILDLDGNNLSDLPDGIFEGLGALYFLNIDENPGAPFTLTAELEARDGDVVVKVAEGAPFDMVTTLAASGGTLSTSTVTIAAGNTERSAVGVTPNGDEAVVVSVVSVALPLFSTTVNRNGDPNYFYWGIQTGQGESLTIPRPNSQATGPLTISGTAQVGQTLTADTSGISDADGLENVSYSYQWLSSRDTEIDGATSSTYTLKASDNGKVIKVRVTFTDDAGNDESLTSAETSAVVLGGL